jgi:hypothetical protein
LGDLVIGASGDRKPKAAPTMEARRHREQPRSGDREKAKAYLGLTRISADQRKSEIAPLINTDDTDRGTDMERHATNRLQASANRER